MNVADHQNPPRVDTERASRRDQDERVQAHPNPRQPATSANPILTAVIALICGVAGAAGYSYFFAPKPAEPSQSKTEAAADKKSSSTRSGEAQSAEAQSLTPGSSSAQAADDLKQQIMSLSKRIDRLGERVDRLQELLSLAVPLLQRIAPKQ